MCIVLQSVCLTISTDILSQAQKFGALADDENEDDDLGEESLLETPLDRVEPYQLFRDALMGKSFSQPNYRLPTAHLPDPRRAFTFEGSISLPYRNQ